MGTAAAPLRGGTAHEGPDALSFEGSRPASGRGAQNNNQLVRQEATREIHGPITKGKKTKSSKTSSNLKFNSKLNSSQTSSLTFLN